MADIDLNGKLDEKLTSARKTFAQTIKKVTEDTATLNFNTAISQMMIFINELSKLDTIPVAIWSDFVKVLSPYAPHLGEELWEKLGNKDTIAYVEWPKVNEAWTHDSEKTIVVMVNGKLRGKFQAASGAADNVLKENALKEESVKKFIDGHEIVKCVVVKDKLVNFVIK